MFSKIIHTINYHLLILLTAALLPGCQHSKSQTKTVGITDSIVQTTRPQTTGPRTIVPEKSKTAQRFDSLGLVDITEIDSTVAVHLLYATAGNFLGEVLYEDLTEAYLHPDAAQALSKAQVALREEKPGYRLIIYDATRPISVQKKMWDVVKGTPKHIYVSNPARGGGLHNYGLAVDVSILDQAGNPVSMGTEVDHLGYEAHTNNEQELVRKGIITAQESQNRQLLRKVMRGAGFRALNSEWWHFNYCSRDEARRKYKLVE